MTRRHYRKIAAIIQEAKELANSSINYTHEGLVFKIQCDLGIMLAEDNPRFDIGKFNKACIVRRSDSPTG